MKFEDVPSDRCQAVSEQGLPCCAHPGHTGEHLWAMPKCGSGQMITPEELARLKAIAYGKSESEFDLTFWSDGGKTVQALITTIEEFQKELRACRGLLADVIATAPSDAPNRPSIKAAADWLANWNGERLDCGSDDAADVAGVVS